ncbi:MAG: hypothetical protein SPJ13_04035 [Bacteroidales bacterium]|nr:hypothetical protein [Bacteroidales bacterium]
MLELARFFNERRGELKHDVVLFFSGFDERQDEVVEVFREEDTGLRIVLTTVLQDDIATQRFTETDNDTAAQAASLYYTISTDLLKASNILSPILMKEVDSESFYDNSMDWRISWITVNENGAGIFPEKYRNTPEYIDYVKLAQNLAQLEEVLWAFNKANLEKAVVRDKEGNVLYLPYVENSDAKGGLSFARNSSLSVHLLAGSGCHEYHYGNITGRPLLACGAGADYRWQFAEIFAVKLGANYEHVSLRGHYGKVLGDVLSVPLTLVATSGVRSNNEVYVETGAYIDHFIGMNQKKVDKVALNNEFRPTLFGIQYAVGMRFGRLMVSYVYKESFSNALKNGDNRITSVNNYFVLGFRF